MSLHTGDFVRVTAGPYADFVGAVDEVNLEKGRVRVKVIVSFFGRETLLELDFEQVNKL